MKNMANNNHNRKHIDAILAEIEKHLTSNFYGELILLMKLQGGVIQISKIREFEKEDTILIK